jgi:hypothetical protein
MSDWGDQEFQKALDENSVILHEKWVKFPKQEKVTQYYSNKTKGQCVVSFCTMSYVFTVWIPSML